MNRTSAPSILRRVKALDRRRFVLSDPAVSGRVAGGKRFPRSFSDIIAVLNFWRLGLITGHGRVFRSFVDRRRLRRFFSAKYDHGINHVVPGTRLELYAHSQLDVFHGDATKRSHVEEEFAAVFGQNCAVSCTSVYP